MKKLIIFFISIFCYLQSNGQSEHFQLIKTPTAFNKAKIQNLFTLPKDTVANADSGSIAVINGLLFIKNGRWELYLSGEEERAVVDTNSLSNRINERMRYADTLTLVETFIRKADTAVILAPYQKKSDTTIFTSGIQKTGNQVIALHDNALWNARWIQNYYVSPVQPTHDYVLKFNGAAMRWEPAPDAGGSGGTADGNNFTSGVTFLNGVLTTLRSGMANITTDLNGYWLKVTDTTNKWQPKGLQDQADWNEVNTASNSFIKNKPVIPDPADGSETKVTAGTNVTVTGSGTIASPFIISAIGGDTTIINNYDTTINNYYNAFLQEGQNISISGTGTSNDPYIISSDVLLTEADPVFGASPAATITNTNISNWINAYNKKITGIAVSGTNTKTITLTAQDGTTLTGTFTDMVGEVGSGDGNDYVNLGSFDDLTGDVTLTRTDAGTVVYNMDGRYSLIDHTHTEVDPVWLGEKNNYYTKTNLQTTGQAQVHWNNISNAPAFLTSYTETDPVFNVHVAAAITSTLINNWNTAYGWGNHATAGYLTSLAHNHGVANSIGAQQFTFGVNDNLRFEGTGSATVSFDAATKKVTINSASADGNNYLTGATFTGGSLSLARNGLSAVTVSLDGRYLQSYTETDPLFTAHVASSITSTNLSNWTNAYNKKIIAAAFSGTATKTLTLTAQDGTTITASFNDISGLEDFTETDPIFSAHVSSGITQADIDNWNDDQNTTYDGSETKLNAGTNINITGSGTVASPYVVNGNFSYTETDPVFIGHVAYGISSANISNWINAYNKKVTGINVTGTTTKTITVTQQDGSTLTGTFTDIDNNTIADGSETKVNAGTDISITGTGTTGNPYVINSTFTQTNADWNSGSGASQILNKPTFHNVAFSGNYNDLINKPSNSFYVQAGTNITVTGDGTQSTPFIISASGVGDSTNTVINDLEYVVGTTAGAPTNGLNYFVLPPNSDDWEARLFRGRLRMSTIDDGSGVYYSKAIGSDTLFLYGDTWHEDELVTIEFYRTAPSNSGSGSSYTFQHSIVDNSGTVNLVGDEASPGNLKYYGTDGTGVKGFHDFPAGGSSQWTDITGGINYSSNVSIGDWTDNTDAEFKIRSPYNWSENGTDKVVSIRSPSNDPIINNYEIFNILSSGLINSVGGISVPGVLIKAGDGFYGQISWGGNGGRFQVNGQNAGQWNVDGGLPSTFNLQYGIKVGTNSTTNGHASSLLDAVSTTKGTSPFPRMTASEKTAISSPTIGLHIYQTDGTEGVYVYKSTGWTLAY